MSSGTRVVPGTSNPMAGLRPQRVARRRDLPAVPGRQGLGRPGLVGLLRRLPARRRDPARARPRRPPRTATRLPPQRRPAPPRVAAPRPSPSRGPTAPRRAAAPPAAAPRRSQRPRHAPATQPQSPPQRRGADVRRPAARAPPPASWPTWRRASTVPTATSVRAVPAKLLIDNRIVINNHLARARGGKVSFTHLIGYAVVRGAQADARDERRLRRGRRQARRCVKPGARQPRPRDRPGQAGRHPPARSCRPSSTPRRWTSPSSGRPTRTSSARRAPEQADASTTSRAPRSA